MPIRCKSCGYLNKEGTKNCERCSFDLRYSIIFDKAVENETSNPKMLFDIEKEPEFEETSFENTIDYETETNVEDKQFKNHEILTNDYNSELKQKYQTIANKQNSKLKIILLFVSVESLVFMSLYLFFYLLIKFLFPSLSLENSNLLIVTILFYIFINIYALMFKGKIISAVLLENKIP